MQPATKEKISSISQEIPAKSVVMIIAPKDFRDEEYFIPKEILEKEGIKVVTASRKVGLILGKFGGEAKAEIALADLKVEDFEAIIFIGGSGAHQYIDDSDCHRIAKKSVEQDKILAAICIAPAILAKAGVLSGKKATVWSSLMDKTAVKILEEAGAIYLKENLVQDGKIISAAGPEAAEDFGKRISQALKT